MRAFPKVMSGVKNKTFWAIRIVFIKVFSYRLTALVFIEKRTQSS